MKELIHLSSDVFGTFNLTFFTVSTLKEGDSDSFIKQETPVPSSISPINRESQQSSQLIKFFSPPNSASDTDFRLLQKHFQAVFSFFVFFLFFFFVLFLFLFFCFGLRIIESFCGSTWQLSYNKTVLCQIVSKVMTKH